ncbi:MAG TPA: tetratricopeptide repeat protein, partial [Candidatus Ozemobacteraceae bacterium]|nr:tetratricopeptide repeat protein [Candidatus Ozemobacteraceae bacterium]
ALQIDPSNVETMNNIGTAFASLGMFGKAALWYEKALAEDPDYALAHLNLANAKFELHQFDEASAHAEKAAQLDPSSHLEASETLIRKVKAARPPAPAPKPEAPKAEAPK